VKREANYFLQTVFVVLFHFGSAYFLVSVFFTMRAAFLLALAAAGLAVLFYLVLVLTDNAEEGLPIGLVYLSPTIYLAGGILWWGIRLVLAYFDNWPPRF
jgi:hypothetical protein